MPRFNDMINNFINGEVSPRLYGRTESDIYKRSCRVLENMYVYPQGGSARRGGTEFVLDHVQNTADSSSVSISTASRVIPFIYSKDESYLILFHGQSATVGGNYFFTVYHPKTGKFYSPAFNGGVGAGYTGDSVGAGAVSENALSSDDVLKDMQYAQNGDTIIFTHGSFPPFYIKRTAEGAFYTADFYRPYDTFTSTLLTTSGDALWKHWPMTDLNRSATTFTVAATTGNTTVTASTAVFSAGLVGSLFYITDSGVLGVAMFTGYTSTTVMDCSVLKTFPGTTAFVTWGLSSWSKVRGYPRAVTFMGTRVIFGFTSAEPEKIWGSQAKDLFELSNTRTVVPGSTVAADDPFALGMAATEANEGLWLRGSSENLLMGTRGREYSLSGLDPTLTNLVIRQETSYGSEAIQPCVVDDVPIFVQRGFRKLREMLFDYRSNGYTANDITFYAEHMPRKSQEVLGDLYVSKIKQMAYQALDNNLLWVIDTNGYLFCATKSRENTVNAFHRHELGGNYGGNYPQVISVCSIPSSAGASDDLYLLVKRTVNSATVVYLERMQHEFNGTSLHSNLSTRENQPIFYDCAKIFRPVSSNFWAQLRTTGTATTAGGSTTVTTTGTINYTSKYMLAAANTSYLSYDGTSNADFAQTGCIKFKLICFAQGVSGARQTLFSISKANADAHNLIKLQLDGTGTSAFGDVRLTIKDSSAAAIINDVNMGNLYASYPTIQELNFELNYDLTGGATRLFINGKQFGSTISSTGTRDTNIDLIRINADEAGATSRAGFGYKDFAIYNTVQHTADFELFPLNQKTTTIRNLDHLEGQSVKVLGDGNELGSYTVSSGTITLPSTYSTLIIGLSYTNYLELQAVEEGTGIGSAVGSIKRIDRAVVRFNKTAAAQVGSNADDATDIIFRTTDTPMGNPITLVTDDKVVEFPGDYDRQARLIVQSSAGLPCNVTCISMRGVTADV